MMFKNKLARYKMIDISVSQFIAQNNNHRQAGQGYDLLHYWLSRTEQHNWVAGQTYVIQPWI